MSELDNLKVDCPLVVMPPLRWEVPLWAEAKIQNTQSLRKDSAQLGAMIFLDGSILVNVRPLI